MQADRVSQPWWQRGVVYQIYPRSFKDTNGDGIGDLPGVIDRLDYLNDGSESSLGVDAIWLSPFYPSPMADFGYDVSDYCAVDPIFGDLADFDRLVREAHRRGIRIIIDWVPNHTSDQHPWFIESRSSRDNAKRDWYIWRGARPDGSLPNNWGSLFGGPAWTLDPATGQYYLHQFVKQQPELNWRNAELKTAMLETLRFWLRRGVDGFRMDVLGMLIKDRELRDNPPNPDASPNLPANDLAGRLLPLYTFDRPEIHALVREIRGVLDEFDERCGIGELWGELPRWVRYYGQAGDELHLPFNFRLMDEPWRADAVRGSVDALEAALPAFAWPNYVLGNHDRPRLASRVGGQAQARVAAMLLLTLRGTPTLYYGDELGLEDGVIPAHKVQDPQGINLGQERTRDVCRTPMQWDAGPQAGFSTAEPWLPVSDDYAARNVAAQSADPASILNLYRRLLWYRRRHPSLAVGGYRPLEAPPDCFVYVRAHGDERHLVALNFSAEERAISLPAPGAGRLALSTYLDRAEQPIRERALLRPQEGLLIQLD